MGTSGVLAPPDTRHGGAEHSSARDGCDIVPVLVALAKVLGACSNTASQGGEVTGDKLPSPAILGKSR